MSWPVLGWVLCWTALCWACVQSRVYSTAGTPTCTYSFTVPSHDVRAICHKQDQPYLHGKDSPTEIDMDGATAKQVLTTVTKLLGQQNLLDDIHDAKQMVRRMNQTLSLQADQYQQLTETTARLQKQLESLSSGPQDVTQAVTQPFTDVPQQAKEPIKFSNFKDDTHAYRGCPVAHSRRIHSIAPIKSMAEKTIRILPQSCYEWRQLGHTTRGLYQIDPDGLEGEPPLTVECVMAATPFAVVHHDAENRTRVKGYEAQGSYVKHVKYQSLTEAQLASLTESSSKCEQYLKWECKGASLRGNSWWTSRAGRKMDYWAGGVSPGSFCACGIDRSCARGGGDCNCDANVDHMWLEDSGYLVDKYYLPVSALHLGDTGNQAEEGYFTLGPLRCYSKVMSPYKTSTALLPVETFTPFPVYCDYEGWLVIQRNTLGHSNTFRQGWTAYEQGFGDMDGDYWLGLEKIYQLTSQKGIFYTLQITLDIGYGTKRYANYNYFKISGRKDGYRLEIGEFNGTLINEMRDERGMQFSTEDRDNDGWRGGNCASRNGGWWFRGCGQVNLNANREIKWGRMSYIRSAEMKIKPFNEP